MYALYAMAIFTLKNVQILNVLEDSSLFWQDLSLPFTLVLLFMNLIAIHLSGPHLLTSWHYCINEINTWCTHWKTFNITNQWNKNWPAFWFSYEWFKRNRLRLGLRTYIFHIYCLNNCFNVSYRLMEITKKWKLQYWFKLKKLAILRFRVTYW